MKNKLIPILDFLNEYPKPIGPGESQWFKTRDNGYIIEIFDKLKKIGIKEWYVLNDDQYVDSFWFDIDLKNNSLELFCALNRFNCDEMNVKDDMLQLWWD